MAKKSFHIFFAAALTVIACSCGGSHGSGTAGYPEFFSGILSFGEEGQEVFTDCATRLSMRLDRSAGYGRLHQEYEEHSIRRDEGIHIEFYGLLLDGRGDGSATVQPDGAVIPPPVPVVRIDSLLNFDREGECLADYTVPGIYRGDRDGQPVILRLRPRYVYTLENLSGEREMVLSEGRWYRSSILTIELEDKNTGETVSFQVVPARDSLTRTDGGGTEVYVKEWL